VLCYDGRLAMAIVKVQLSFQLSPNGDVLRRKALLSFQAHDTLECVCSTINGELGSRPLCPRGFLQRLEQGGIARMFLYFGETVVTVGGSTTPVWSPAPAQAMLGDLVKSSEPNGVLSLLLRMEQPTETNNDSKCWEISKEYGEFSSPGAAADDVASTQVELSGSLQHLCQGGSCFGCSTEEVSVGALGTWACGVGQSDGDDMLYMHPATLDSLPPCGQDCADEAPASSQGGEQDGEVQESNSFNDAEPGASFVSAAPTLLGQVHTHPGVLAGNGQSYLIHPVPFVGQHAFVTGQMVVPRPIASGPATAIPVHLPRWTMMPSAGSMVTMTSATTVADTLFNMVSNNDVQGVKQLLSHRANINACTAHGSYVLFRAVIKARDPKLVQLLLSSGANVQACDNKGKQVMHFWARATVGRHHLFEIGRCLVLARADINAQRAGDGMSPLHHIVVAHNSRRGWLDFHKALLLVRCGANIRLTTSENQFPCNLLTLDGRGSTRKLLQLLTTGVQFISTGCTWPRCETGGCPWCD